MVIWGLPIPLVEAVALHYCPSRSKVQGFSPLTAVHVANVFQHKPRAKQSEVVPTELDLVYLKNSGLERRIDAWRGRCLNSADLPAV